MGQIFVKAYRRNGKWIKAHRRKALMPDLRKLSRKPPMAQRVKNLALRLDSPWRANYRDQIPVRFGFVKKLDRKYGLGVL